MSKVVSASTLKRLNGFVMVTDAHLGFVINTLRPRQNGRHFADDTFKCIFLNENVWIPIKTPLKFVPKGPINNIPAMVQIMAWRRPGDKPLSGPMMVRLPTHICVTRPQWVNFSDFLFIFAVRDSEPVVLAIATGNVSAYMYICMR